MTLFQIKLVSFPFPCPFPYSCLWRDSLEGGEGTNPFFSKNLRTKSVIFSFMARTFFWSLGIYLPAYFCWAASRPGIRKNVIFLFYFSNGLLSWLGRARWGEVFWGAISHLLIRTFIDMITVILDGGCSGGTSRWWGSSCLRWWGSNGLSRSSVSGLLSVHVFGFGFFF